MHARLRSGSLLWTVALGVAVLGLAGAAAAEPSLDKGLLDPAWFAPDAAFHKTDDIDYLWVRDGFSLRNRRLEVAAWEEPRLLRPRERSPRDQVEAVALTPLMPALLRATFAEELRKYLQVVPEGEQGDLVVSGRIVDCDRGSEAARFLIGFGAGSSSATWDIKFVDRASGQAVAGLHHRSLSGAGFSDMGDTLADWFEELSEAIRDDLSEVYRDGKPAKR
jgi:uncharacterized protein DUF4410